MSLDVLSSSLKIRNQLFEEARRRKSGVNTGSGGAWIPELSRLAGKLMDLFAVQIIQEYTSRRDAMNEGKENLSEDGLTNGNTHGKKGFNPQEMASALWVSGYYLFDICSLLQFYLLTLCTCTFRHLQRQNVLMMYYSRLWLRSWYAKPN